MIAFVDNFEQQITTVIRTMIADYYFNETKNPYSINLDN